MLQLLATYGWILDVAFFAVLFIGLFVGIGVGFVRGVGKIAGTVLSFLVATTFCTPVTGLLEDWFGLVTMFGNAIHLKTVAYWLIVAASFVVLALLTWLTVFLVSKLGKKIVRKSKVLDIIDRVLGGILGFCEAALIALFLLAVCKWIRVDVVEEYIASSRVVYALYGGDWFNWLAGIPWRFLQGGKDAISLLAAWI